MSTVPTKKLDGDVSVGRNATISGKATVNGTLDVKKNVKIEGWLDAKNIKGPNKGHFKSPESLREAYPIPQPGWWAVCGETLPAWLHIADGDKWVGVTDKNGDNVLAGSATIDSEVYAQSVEELSDEIASTNARVSTLEAHDNYAYTEELKNATIPGIQDQFTAVGKRVDTLEAHDNYAYTEELKNATIPGIQDQFTAVGKRVDTLEAHDNYAYTEELKNATIPGIQDQFTAVGKRVDTLEAHDNYAYTETLKNTTIPDIRKEIADINGSVGTADGIAPLGSDGLVPASYLPSFVDDVKEFMGDVSDVSVEDGNAPGIGEIVYNTTTNRFLMKIGNDNAVKYYAAWEDSGLYGTIDNDGVMPMTDKVYVDTSTNKTYRWSGATLVVIGSDLALGYTSSTAFPGNDGKALQSTVKTLIGDNSELEARTESVEASTSELQKQTNQAETDISTLARKTNILRTWLQDIGIYPFNGVLGEDFEQPKSGVWLITKADGDYQFVDFSGDNSFNGFGEEVYNTDTVANSSNIYRCEENLYQIVNGEFLPIGDTTVLQAKVNNIHIVPFSGIYSDKTGSQPTSGVWFVKDDDRSYFIINKRYRGYDATDYNTYDTNGVATARTDMLFRCGNVLYRLNNKDNNLVEVGGASVGNCYNLTSELPLAEELYYSMNSASKYYAPGIVISEGKAALGLQITFAIADGSWKTYQYIGKTTDDSDILNVDNWLDLAGLSAGTEPFINVNKIYDDTDYELTGAINAILKCRDNGINYIKPGLAFTYRTAERKDGIPVWATKQFVGSSETDFKTTNAELFVDYGQGGKTSVVTKDEPESGGTDALSTGGAYNAIPTNIKVDTETAGVVKLALTNAEGQVVGDEAQFGVGTGSGSAGLTVEIIPEATPFYAKAGGDVTLKASILVKQGSEIKAYNIEKVELYDIDSKVTLETFSLNKASSLAEDAYDFSFDLSSYFTAASSRKLRLTAYDDADHSGYRNITITAVDVTITAEGDLNYSTNQALVVGGKSKSLSLYKFENNASAKGITAITEIYLNNKWQELGRETVYNTYTRSVSIDPCNCLGWHLSHGAYMLRIHGEDLASGVIGNYLYTSIMVVEDGNKTPIVAVRWLSDEADTTIKQYETASFEYAVYSTALSAEVYIYQVQDGKDVLIKSESASRAKTYTYTQKIKDVKTDGTEYAEFVVKSTNGDSKTVKFKVVGSLIDVEAVTTQLMLEIDFQNRSNNDADKTISSEGYVLSVDGANWRTNGFVKDSFGSDTYGQANDPGIMTLRVAEDLHGELNYHPFDDAYIETNGMAVQFKVMKKHIADDSAKLLTCFDGTLGFYIDGNQFVFTTDGGKTTAHTIKQDFNDDEVMDVTLVIEPYTIAPYSGIGNCILYVDGEKAGACYYDRGSLSRHTEPIRFDGTNGDLYVYNMRAWKTYFAYEQAFNNYLLNMNDTDEMIDEYEFNQVMESQVAENTTKNRPKQSALEERGINRVVLCKTASTANEEKFYPDYLEGLDGDKKTSINLDWYHYFAETPWLNFIVYEDPTTNQGTTSSMRPDKNKKGKNKKALSVKMMYTREYVAEVWPEHLGDYDRAAGYAAKKKVQIKEGAIPQSIETIKVDYSESGGANNGAICEMWNDLTRALGSEYMTPAQNAYTGEYELNPAIASIPVALYRTDKYSSDATSPSYGYFHCKGNLNQDKGDAYVFGFEKVEGYNDKCLNYGDFYELVAGRDQDIDEFIKSQDKTQWNFLESTETVDDGFGNKTTVNHYWDVILVSEFCGPKTRIFRRADNNSEWAETTGKMYYSNGSWVVEGDVLNPVDNFELKKYVDLCWFQGVNTVDDMIGDGSTPKWLEYFESRYPDDDNLNALYEAGKKVPYNLYNWLRFCQDCNQHLTEADGNITIGGKTVAGTAANRLKKWEQDLHTIANVKSLGSYHILTDYKAAVDQRSKNMMVGFYLDTDSVIRMYLNHLYDGDTIDESDNDCGLTIPWNLDPNNDTRGMYQGWDSVLFVQMAKAGNIWLNDDGSKTITLKAIAKEMREAKRSDGLQPFSVEGCRKYWVTDRLSKWPKLVSSYDGDRKYIEHSKSTANYYYALHGLGINRIMNFIEKRFEYRDGYYECGDLFKSIMGFRAIGTDISVRIVAAKAGFFGIGVDRANESDDSCYLEVGEEHVFHTGITNTGSGTMLYLFGANRIGELDLSGCTASSQGWNISELVLLKRFIIGGENYVSAESAQETLANLDLGELPFLTYLDVRNTTLVNIKATYCPRLETILAGGSKLTKIDLAETAPVSTLELPDTMTELTLVNLPNLTYPGGLSIGSFANVSKVRVSSCDKVDAMTLINGIIASSAIKYIRLEDVNIVASSGILTALKDSGAVGLDSDGNIYDENGQCSGITGRWILSNLLDDSELESLQTYFPELTLYNSQYSTICYSDLADDTANISNMEDSTGYKFNNTYTVPAHWQLLDKKCHVQKATYSSKDKMMTCVQISDETYTELADGTSFDPSDASGLGFDVMKYIVPFYMKGINDYKNQDKYTFLSALGTEPISTASIVKRSKLADLLLKPLSAIFIDSNEIGGDCIIEDNANMNVYEFDVEGMKQVRWPGVNSASVGAIFLDEDGKVLSKFNMEVGSSQFDFVIGDYIFIDVPTGAKKFIFTSYAGYDDQEAIAVDSSEIEAIEPDWVKCGDYLLGVYGGYVDSLKRMRSISGVQTTRGDGTYTTNSEWNYDENGDLTNTIVPTSTMHYTSTDLINMCRMRGEGFQAEDQIMETELAQIIFGIVGDRDIQAICGYGCNNDYITGAGDTYGNITYKGSSTGYFGNLLFGIMNYIACCWEAKDFVGINISNYLDWRKGRYSEGDATYPVDDKWHIYDTTAKTERIVQGINATGYCIGRVKHGLYCDIIASKVTSDSSQWNKNYADMQSYSHTRGRLPRRSGVANAYGGLVFVNAGGGGSDSVAVCGVRLAFRGKIVFK